MWWHQQVYCWSKLTPSRVLATCAIFIIIVIWVNITSRLWPIYTNCMLSCCGTWLQPQERQERWESHTECYSNITKPVEHAPNFLKLDFHQLPSPDLSPEVWEVIQLAYSDNSCLWKPRVWRYDADTCSSRNRARGIFTCWSCTSVAWLLVGIIASEKRAVITIDMLAFQCTDNSRVCINSGVCGIQLSVRPNTCCWNFSQRACWEGKWSGPCLKICS